MEQLALKQLLSSLGSQAPLLLVLGVGLWFVLTAPRANFRGLAASALAILLASHLLHAVLLVVVPLFIVSSGYDMSKMATLYMAVGIGFSLLKALAYGMLIWVILQALRQLHAAATM